MYNLDLCHFGNQCAPGILIDDILNIHKKTLFMLGIFRFNDILHYLNENNYENIYDKKCLVPNSNTDVVHTSYYFHFNHDYIIENSNFTNYDFVKKRFDVKIKNFRDMLANESKTIFINFCENIDTIDINGMLLWLQNNKKNFHLIIFTYNDYSSNYESNNLSIIKLQNNYGGWWDLNEQKKVILYNEIYEEFLNCLENANIENDFPKTYNNTYYGKIHPI